MRLPTRTIELPGGLSCPTVRIEQGPWLAHVVKHPIGLDAVLGRPPKAPWNREGWDALTPPVVEYTERDRLVRNIAALEVDGARCGIPELRGARGESDPTRLACHVCPQTLAAQCAWVLDGVSTAYAAVTMSLLDGLAGTASVPVPKASLTRSLARLFARPGEWSSLSVLSVGLDARQRAIPIARISRADGVRAEFYVQGRALRWRTTWRERPAHAAQAMSFLLDVAPAGNRAAPLSDQCLVDRLWWERHGT